jgi:hypothetical protein
MGHAARIQEVTKQYYKSFSHADIEGIVQELVPGEDRESRRRRSHLRQELIIRNLTLAIASDRERRRDTALQARDIEKIKEAA